MQRSNKLAMAAMAVALLPLVRSAAVLHPRDNVHWIEGDVGNITMYSAEKCQLGSDDSASLVHINTAGTAVSYDKRSPDAPGATATLNAKTLQLPADFKAGDGFKFDTDVVSFSFGYNQSMPFLLLAQPPSFLLYIKASGVGLIKSVHSFTPPHADYTLYPMASVLEPTIQKGVYGDFICWTPSTRDGDAKPSTLKGDEFRLELIKSDDAQMAGVMQAENQNFAIAVKQAFGGTDLRLPTDPKHTQ